MNHRERFLAVLEGRLPDRSPVVCRLDLWYRDLLLRGDPQGVLAGRSLEQIQLDLGYGVSARAGQVYTTRLREPVRYQTTRDGQTLHEHWHTPLGSLHRVSAWHGNDEQIGIRPHIIEYPVRQPADFDILACIARHTEYVADHASLPRYDQQIGDRGFPMTIIGVSPAHDILLRWTGYEAGYLQLADDPAPFDAAFEALSAMMRTMWPIVAQSPAALVMHGVNFDVSVTPPPLFEKYFLPYLAEFNQCMHQVGKRVAFHGDGELDGLLDLILACGYDVADCLACAPMTRCPLQTIVDRFGDQVVIWGGVPSTLLEPGVSDQQFFSHLELIRRTVPAHRLMVGLADQAMPTSRYDRLVQLGAFFAGADASGRTA